MGKKDVCVIRAKLRNDYVFNAYLAAGYRAVIPYKDYNLFFRLVRELWYRAKLPHREWFYNPQLKRITEKKIIVKDPLITPDFMRWLRKTYPDKEIKLSYENRADRTSINPRDIGDEIAKKSSYDGDDCKRYGMSIDHPSYFANYRILDKDKKPIRYDVVYLGRDKGRADMLLELQLKMEQMGLRTYFHICADRSYLRFKRSYYKPLMEYTEYIELLKETRAHLNIVINDQASVTQRDMESIFDNVKCITNNKNIRNFELYHPSRFFILGEDDFSRLKAFLDEPFLRVPEDVLDKYTFR